MSTDVVEGCLSRHMHMRTQITITPRRTVSTTCCIREHATLRSTIYKPMHPRRWNMRAQPQSNRQTLEYLLSKARNSPQLDIYNCMQIRLQHIYDSSRIKHLSSADGDNNFRTTSLVVQPALLRTACVASWPVKCTARVHTF